MNKKTATIKILDEINIVVIGLTIDEYKHFYNKYGLLEKDYFFTARYKVGKWDGKCRLFSLTGKTSIHFVKDIIHDLKDFGYKIKVKDNRNPITWDVPLVDSDTFKEHGIILGEHQVKSINALLENRGGIGLAATGAGKSYILGALFSILNEYMGLKCLAIVPSLDLVEQTAKEIQQFGNKVGMYNATKKDLTKTHLVSTWQSLQNSPEIVDMYNAIIVDEAHGAKSSVLKTLLMQHASNALFIAGVTGTLPKHSTDLRKIKYVLGNVVSNVEGKYLIDKGWLANLNIHCFTVREDLTEQWDAWKHDNPKEAKRTSYKQFKEQFLDDYTAESKWIKRNHDRNLLIADLILRSTQAFGNSFVLVNGVSFGRKLSKLIPNSIFIDGNDASSIRKEIYDMYATKNDMIVIATFSLASTGLNIKRIFNLFLVDAGRSFIRTIQSIGRGLRKASDKDNVNVFDINSDLKYSKKHFSERKSFYKEKQYPYEETFIKYSSALPEISNKKKIDVDIYNETVVK